MSYENAPATKLVATHCAACARPLVDAVSVETGMGPDCRKKHYSQPDVAVDALYITAALAVALPEDVYVELCGFVNALPAEEAVRKTANVIVHRIAVEQTGPLAAAYVEALSKLGFRKLADRIADRLGRVVVEQEGRMLVVRTPYNEAFVSLVRGLPGRRFDGKANRVPVEYRKRLWGFLKTTFPVGTVVVGPKGAVAL